MQSPMLLGREAELHAIAEVVADAQRGRGRCLRFEGEPGIGKSSLLDRAVLGVPDDVRVLRVNGFESEVDLPWSGVDVLVAPLLADGVDDAVAAPRRVALRRALALAGRDAEVDAFAAVAAVGDLVLAAAARSPILVVVDDAQWIDAPSARALRHGSRRWLGERVGVVEASRLDGSVVAVGERRRLGPIGDPSALDLLAAAGVESAAVRERVVAELGGRPLLLAAAATQLAGEVDLDWLDGRAPLPVAPSVRSYAEARLAGLSRGARSALVIAATEAGGDVAVIGRALGAAGSSLDDLDEAERAGILRLEGGRVVFDHPSLRSAAYHGARSSERRDAHRRVGAAIGDPVERAQHLALGATGPDPALSDELVGASELLVRRAAPIEAARSLELAARLAPDPSCGAVLLRRSAELLADTAATAHALRLLDRADLVRAPKLELVRRRAVRLRIEARHADASSVPDRLVALADEIEAEDPGLAADLLFQAMPPLIRSMRGRDVRDVGRRLDQVTGLIDDPALRLRADVALGAAMVAAGDPAGMPRLDRHLELLEVEGVDRCGTFLAEVVAPVVGFLTKGTAARRLLDSLESALRERAGSPVLVSVLGARAMLSHGTDLAAVVAAGTEARSVADSIGQPELARLVGCPLVIGLAVAGDDDGCRSLAEELGARPDRFSRRAALIGLGVLALGRGELDAAIGCYERLQHEFGVGDGVVRWELEWAETLVRAHRREEASAAIATIEDAGLGRSLDAGLERLRGMLEDDDRTAEAHFERSIDGLNRAGNVVSAGRTHLAWGERLRRARRRAAARRQLDCAHELFVRTGAVLWDDRARAELALATSGVSETTESGLTAQELHVARLAARGASNKEIAHELYLSPRTVEAHLTAIYRKLGVRNRRELAARAIDDAGLRA